ncbi:quinone oxidoreductase 12 [Heterobasidion irregulare TC 32-1]|uniref:Quinone oxidoreductase 12 n=1 Tax=Heterobasidion irregulare (strain TC 32-1) TaxID=747525 RepID=W4KH98_HETIT|nr:quinone oxidoreductase 12 [Heterobasidion irregulare TC 32-1]ETW84421.1 quinone oxidoreductase 12 [Heterobasidion irregulare TC 32-1]
MKAFVVREYAHPSDIKLTLDAPNPTVTGKDTVLVDVYSAGLNFFDILQAQGKYQNKPPFPFVLGSEFSGIIARDSPIPSGSPFKPGDRVFGSAQGALGECVAASWKNLLPLPDSLTFDQGAGLFVTWPTSYEALVGRAQLKPGEWVLVTAAAGGVGIAAVQLAKALGAKVIAAASPAKLSVTRDYGGADFAIDYTKKGWQQEVMKITGGHGVDVVYDPVGMIRDSLKCIAWSGRALIIGFAGGEIEKIPMNLALLKNVSLIGVHWGSYITKDPNHVPEVWNALLGLLAQRRVLPVIYSQTYTLDTVVQGLDDLEKRKTWGKAIVRVRESLANERAKL